MSDNPAAEFVHCSDGLWRRCTASPRCTGSPPLWSGNPWVGRLDQPAERTPYGGYPACPCTTYKTAEVEILLELRGIRAALETKP